MVTAVKTEVISETPYSVNYANKVHEKHLYQVNPKDGQNILYCVIHTIFNYLSSADVRKKTKPVAVVVRDEFNNFLFGGAIMYDTNEDSPDMPGNWDLMTTFNEDDIKAIGAQEIAFFENSVIQCNYTTNLAQDFGYVISDDNVRTVLTTESFLCIKTMLDQNAEEGYKKVITIPDLVDISVEVDLETKEKTTSIVPSAVAKQSIKNDSSASEDIIQTEGIKQISTKLKATNKAA